ncbi:MAG TPA: CPBP family intramembrane glutamic endopeptidase, partial [Candidatus Omnitrophota bacterium]|nr:CPBP family intramembrane glutamic endopeptidase [Candidatus Omnitrophota bacterium]
LIYFTFFVAILGPIIEEVFFRGFAYTAFRRKWGVVRGMLASSAVFALMHMNLIAFFPIFVLGIFLAYLFEKTGSLVPSMTVHMVHNLIMVSLTLGFKSATG